METRMSLPVIVRNRVPGYPDEFVNATLIDFQTVSKTRGKGEEQTLEGIIFGIVITEKGAIMARRLSDIRMAIPTQE